MVTAKLIAEAPDLVAPTAADVGKWWDVPVRRESSHDDDEIDDGIRRSMRRDPASDIATVTKGALYGRRD